MRAMLRASCVLAILMMVAILGGTALAESAGPPKPPSQGATHKVANHRTYSGVVKEKSANGFVLAVKGKDGVSFSISSDTKFQVPGEANATFDDIAPGGRVLVLAVDSGDRNLALQVRLTPEEMAGVVKSVNAGANTFVLTTRAKGDVAIQVGAETKFSIPGKKDAGLADIGAGASASVLVSVVSSGNVAVQVRLVPIQVIGKIASVDPAAKSIVVARPQGNLAVVVNTNTRLKSAANKDAAFGDLKAGARVAVTAIQAPGAAMALEIRIMPVELDGKVKSVDGAGKTFILTARSGDAPISTNTDTKYALAGNAAGSFADLQAGQRVTVVASETAGGHLALNVRFLPVELSGTIKAVNAAAKNLVLASKEAGDITLLVNDKTRYQVPGDKDVTLADVRVGSRVVALAVPSAGGSLAAFVRLMPVELTGKIKSVDPGAATFVMPAKNGDVTFSVDSRTRFLIPGSKDGKLGDLKAGNVVTVKAIGHAAGALALHVQLRPVDVNGKVKSVDSGGKSFVLASRSGADMVITVEAGTKVRTSADKEGTLADVRAGITVDVRALDVSGGKVALSVRVLPIELVGQIKSVDAAAKTFVLATKTQGDVVIKVTGTTRIKNATGGNASFSDIQAGSTAIVTAEGSANGKVALQMRMLPPPKARPAPASPVRK